MDLLQLEYFVAVAKCEHMTQAALKLHISQPTLSQVIARLEKDLGVLLFDRHGKHLKLNENGKLLLERATFILSYIKNTESEFKKYAIDENNDIYIRMYGGHYIFSDLIKKFKDDYPYTRFHLLSNEDAPQETLSIGFINTWTDSLNGVYLFDDEMRLLVSKKSPLANRSSVDLAELKTMDFINNTTGFLKNITQPYCERAGFIPKFSYTAQNNTDVTMLIELDYGIAFWPKMALSEILTDHMAVVELRRPVCIRSMFLKFPEGRQLTVLEQTFAAYCQDYFGAAKEANT